MLFGIERRAARIVVLSLVCARLVTFLGGVFFGKNVDEENTLLWRLSLSEERTHKKKVQKTLNPKQETKGLILFFVQIDPHTNKKRPPLCISPAHDEQSFESENEERERFSSSSILLREDHDGNDDNDDDISNAKLRLPQPWGARVLSKREKDFGGRENRRPTS